MGATRGVLVTDPALAGSCTVSTARVLAAALARARVRPGLSPGSTPPTGSAGSSRPRSPRLPACRTCRTPPGSSPTRPPAGSASGASARPATTCSRRRCRLSSSCTQALGEPRYPSLKGIMAARSKEIAVRSLADLGLDPATVGGAVATTRSSTVRGAAGPRARPGRPRARTGGRGPGSSTSSSSGGSSDGPAPGSSARPARTAAWPGSAPRSRRSPGRLPSRRPPSPRAGRRGRPGRGRAELAAYLPEVEAVAVPDPRSGWPRSASRSRPSASRPSTGLRPRRARRRTGGTSPGSCRPCLGWASSSTRPG